MKIYNNIEDFSPLDNPVVTVGTFDGVHIGHQKIFRKMAEDAAAINGTSVVVTFHPHPRLVIHPDSSDLKFINTQERKYDLIEQSGIEHLVVIPFTKEFSRTPSSEFVKNILVDKIGVKKLIIGYDHHFGKDRQGSIMELRGLSKIHHFDVEEVDALEVDGIPASSTKIRNALIQGNIRLANTLLGYEYSITGIVVKGNKIGRKIGFPTANIEMHDHYKLISANGVYACRVDYGGRLYKGMGNIGYRPTVDAGDLTIEVNIFDFDEEIYGETITIYFVDRIRDENKFENLAALRSQLTSDKARVMDILQ